MMVVNPQHFNYRLIIGSLTIAIMALSVYAYSTHGSLKHTEKFLEQENHLIQTELKQMLSRYDDMEADNEELSQLISETKQELQSALIELKYANNELSKMMILRNQYQNLKQKNKALLSVVDSLNASNKKLKASKDASVLALESQTKTLRTLTAKNRQLNEKINKASFLSVANVEAKAYKTNLLGKKVYSNRAKRIKTIDVCISLVGNPLVASGEKEIYIQIVDPKNNVVSDKGEARFGLATLIYSHKQIIDYNNTSVDLCMAVEAKKIDRPLLKGLYYINVFNKGQRLGSTTFELK